MKRYIKAELLKIRHTLTLKLVWLTPILCMMLSLLLMPKYFFTNSFNWFYTLLLPGMISLASTQVADQDLKMQSKAILSLPVNLRKVWAAKILICVMMLAISCLFLTVGGQLVTLFFGLHNKGSISFGSALLGALVLAVTFLWQIPLCLLLGNKLGLFPTILINIVCYMVFGVLLAPERIWWMVPYAVPARLMVPIIHVLPNGLPAVSGMKTFTQPVLSSHVIFPGILITVGLFLILSFITAKWYEGCATK